VHALEKDALLLRHLAYDGVLSTSEPVNLLSFVLPFLLRDFILLRDFKGEAVVCLA
jgi:hypothetical protein